MSVQHVVIGIAGLGTVGTGLVKLLKENATEIQRRTGKTIQLKWVAVRDLSKARELPEGTLLTDNPMAIVEDSEVDIVIELMGGIDLAGSLIKKALENGKSVVTANKALLAEKGEELFTLAENNNLCLAYEASVAGAIPIVQTLKDSLAGNQIKSVTGILNGTSNYILTEMAQKGMDFDTALKDAQELGYAEADPTLDIDGFDAAHKLKLLIRLAWGVHYPYEELAVRGIRNISPQDIKFAKELGYSIKLLGEASKINNQIEAGISPFLVPQSSMLARVEGAFNAVHVSGNAVGSLFLHGLGAGSLPTASAVLGDLMSLMRDTYDSTGYANELPLANMLDPQETASPWYLRLSVHDLPGMLRDIAGTFAKYDVSLAQVIQKKECDKQVPLVFMTHSTSAKAITQALADLKALGTLKAEPIAYPVLEG